MKDLSHRKKFRLAVLMVTALVGAAMVVPEGALAQTADGGTPSISLLNPSSGTSLTVSDKGDHQYRVSAWVSSVPASATVEFQLQGAGDAIVIGHGTPTTPGDAFELQWHIPDELADGRYTLRAVLYGDTGAGISRLAMSETTVNILHTSEQVRTGAGPRATVGVAAETVDFTYPGGDGRFRMDMPQGQRAIGTTQLAFTEKTEFVRLFYTVSLPGTQPSWKACGTYATDTTFNGFPCQLAQEDMPSSVTALAAIANTTPSNASNTTDRNQDQSADAVRVIAYVEEPAPSEVEPVIRSIAIGAETTRIEAGEIVRFFGKITAEAEECGREQLVRLKKRRPGGVFRTIGSTTSTTDGAFEFQTTVMRTAEFRAVAPATETCVRATSGTHRVRAQ